MLVCMSICGPSEVLGGKSVRSNNISVIKKKRDSKPDSLSLSKICGDLSNCVAGVKGTPKMS